MINCEVDGLFSIPVGTSILEPALTQGEIDFIMGLEQTLNDGNMTSKDNYVLNQKPLQRVKDFCQLAVSNFFVEVYSPSGNVELYITQSWANYTKSGQYHHKHQHPNSIVSGVFYVNADPDKDKIMFFNSTYKPINFPRDKWNVFNSDSWWFSVKPNELKMFPSELHHSVPPTESKDVRVSIAFNTFVKGRLGEKDRLTELII